MRKKYFLDGLAQIESKIENEKTAIITIRSMAERVTSQMTHNGGKGASSSKIEIGVELLLQKQENLKKLQKQIKHDRLLALQIIDKMENEKEQSILQYLYFINKNISEVANLMMYSRRHVMRLKRSALESFDHIFQTYEKKQKR